MENNINNMDELRSQFALLTEKLKSQQINNERLMREVLRHKMDKVNRYAYFTLYVLLPFGVLSWLFVFFVGFISLSLTMVTILFFAVDTIVDFRINKVMGKGWLEEDLLASRTTLLKMKQARSKHMLYAIPLIIIWWGFVCFDLYSHIEEMLLFKSLVFGGSIGGLVGYAIAYSFYKKMQRINDEVIQQIDRFKADEDREE